jgi:hypothetical protein
MCNVHEKDAPVHLSPSDASLDLDPTDLTDRAWIRGEALQWRSQASLDVFDLSGLVASTLEALGRGLAFHGCWSAADYARVRRIDLDAVRLPITPSRSPLAESLATQAAWYLQLDTRAGQLVAHAILWQASLCDELGSETVEGFLLDEAAFRAVMEDAVFSDLTETFAVAC